MPVEILVPDTSPAEFKLPQPPANLNKDIQVPSLSESDVSYTLNLHLMTCTCPDFIIQKRANRDIENILRPCKHLILQYSRKVDLGGLSDFSKYVIEQGNGLKAHLGNVQIPNTEQYVIVNFDEIDSWWNIYYAKQPGKYKSYGYLPEADRWAYGEKPYGIVIPLKLRIGEIINQFSGSENLQREDITTKDNANDSNTGCGLWIFILWIVIVILLYHFIF